VNRVILWPLAGEKGRIAINNLQFFLFVPMGT
jgi:hypothetical protein